MRTWPYQSLVDRLYMFTKLKTLAFIGVEGSSNTYSARITWKNLAECFDFEPVDMDSESKRQRDLAPARSRSIIKYINKSKDTIIFPQVQAVCERIQVQRLESLDNVVEVTLDEKSWRYLADGQCRLSGIKQAIEQYPELATQSIDIKLIPDRGLAGNRQLTADINKSPLKFPGSQLINFDRENKLNGLVIKVLAKAPTFKRIVEFEKASIVKGSEKLYTLNQFKSFVKLATGLSDLSFEAMIHSKEQADKVCQCLVAYLESLVETCLFEHQNVDTVIPTAVFLDSLGYCGKALLLHFAQVSKVDWAPVKKLGVINYSKFEPEWRGRCINEQGKFVAKSYNKKAVAAVLIKTMEIALPADISDVDDDVFQTRQQILLSV
jgi:DGQHR domain-containing protein